MAVTPFTGVWIEIPQADIAITGSNVTPFTGVWIEIRFCISIVSTLARHSLHGSVD